MPYSAENRISKIIAFTLAIALSMPARSALSFNAFRPASVSSEPYPVTSSLFAKEASQVKASAAGMIIEHGPCTPPWDTVFGKAALISTYSAYDILRHIEQEDIGKEINSLLPALLRDIRAQVNTGGEDTQNALLNELDKYAVSVRRYLKNRRQSGSVSPGQLVKNSIGALAFFVAVDLRKAKSRRDTGKEELLAELLGMVQKRALADIDTSPAQAITPDKARQMWRAFKATQNRLVLQYRRQADLCSRQADEMLVKIKALKRRNKRLAAGTSERVDAEESEAIQRTIEDNSAIVSQYRQAQEDLQNHAGMFNAVAMEAERLSVDYVKGPKNILKTQRSPEELLYISVYTVFEKLSLTTNPFDENMHKTYTVYTDIMKLVESAMADMRGVSPFYIKAGDIKEDLVLLSNYDLPAHILANLLDAQSYKIKAICTLEGTRTSHSTITAEMRGVPTVLLRAEDRSAEDIASISDDMIVETTHEKGTVIARPDAKTISRYELSGARQRLEKAFAIEKYLLRRQAARSRRYDRAETATYDRVSVYAAASAASIGEVRDTNIDGTGLFRTELSMSDRTRRALRHYAEKATESGKNMLLAAFVDDMYKSLNACKDCGGHFVLRTDDFEEDKDGADIVNLLQAKGFDIYRDERTGRAIAALRIASYYIALNHIRRAGLTAKLSPALRGLKDCCQDFCEGPDYAEIESVLDRHLTGLAQDITDVYTIASNIDLLLDKTSEDLRRALSCEKEKEYTTDAALQHLAQGIKEEFITRGDEAGVINILMRQFTEDVMTAFEKEKDDAAREADRLIIQLKADLQALFLDEEDIDAALESAIINFIVGVETYLSRFEALEGKQNTIESLLYSFIAPAKALSRDPYGYRFSPVMIFPMVKQQRDVQFMRDKVIPQARRLAGEYINNDSQRTLPAIAVGPMLETVEAYDNLDFLVEDEKTSLISIGTSDFTQSVFSRETGLDITRGDVYFEAFFTTLKPNTCRKYYEIAQAVSAWNEDYPRNPKVLGFCGAQAETEEFMLFVSFLQKEFKNVNMYISVSANMVPQAELFIECITDADLKIFEKEPGFKTHQLAVGKARGIRERIRKSREYVRYMRENIHAAARENTGSRQEASIPASSRAKPVSTGDNLYKRLRAAA